MKSSLTGLLAAAGVMLGAAGCGVNGLASLAEGPGMAGASLVPAGLPAGTWRLMSLREAGQAEVTVARPDLFTAQFGADGRVLLRADCNRCAGVVTSGSGPGSLNVGPLACTRAYCADTAPLDDTFTRLVSGAKTWTASGPSLELASEVGSLHFQQ